MTTEAEPARRDAARSWLNQILASRWDASLPKPLPLDLWPAVQEEVETQRLGGQLYRPLREHPGLVPADALHWIAALHALTQLRCEHWQRTVKEVLTALEAADIEFAVLKGWWFIEAFFDGDFAQHPINDLDLLVQPTDYEAAQHALFGLGFESTDDDPWPGFKRRFLHEEAYVLTYPDRIRFLTELHWKLGFDLPGFDAVDEAAVLLGSQEATVVGVPCRVPTMEEHFVYCCGHLILQHCDDQAQLFRLYDLALLIACGSRPLNWALIWKRAENWHLTVCVQQCLQTISEHWPGAIPKEVTEAARFLTVSPEEDAFMTRIQTGTASPTYNRFQHFRSLPGLGRQIRFMMEWLVPCPGYMRKRYEIRGGSWSTLMAYPRRWHQGLRILLRSDEK